MIKKCEQCEKEFEAKRKDTKYCSKSCRQKSSYKKTKKQHPEKECLSCGQKYIPTHGSQLYCSDYCKEFEEKESRRLRQQGWQLIETPSDEDAYDGHDYGDIYEDY